MTEDEKLVRLIFGNIGDDTALANICEAQYMEVEELTEEEREFLIHTNSFYYSAEDFCELHDDDEESFQSLVDDGTIVKTTDGFVWKNCV